MKKNIFSIVAFHVIELANMFRRKSLIEDIEYIDLANMLTSTIDEFEIFDKKILLSQSDYDFVENIHYFYKKKILESFKLNWLENIKRNIIVRYDDNFAKVSKVFGENMPERLKNEGWEKIIIIIQNIVADWKEGKHIESDEEEECVMVYAKKIFSEIV